jgi:nitrogen fixation protein FixH
MTAWTWLARNDRWIPALIVAGFLVTVAANGTMIWFALSTWSGLTSDAAYARGLAYDETLAAADASAALGWSVDLVIDGGEGGQIAELVVAQADGAPLDGAIVQGIFVRPTHEGYDFDVAFRQVGAGRYRAEFSAPLAGQWDLRFEIDHGGDVYRAARRVKIAP